MSFGQPAGPPASARDVARLAELVEAAGYASFKEARHPLGLSQRQAGGRFTRDEVAELTARLEAGAPDPADGATEPSVPSVVPRRALATGPASPHRGDRSRGRQRSLAGVADGLLVAELELRGWTCIPPT